MNPYARKILEFVGSLMILIPCVLLMAWEESLPYLAWWWFVLLVGNGMFLYSLHRRECKEGDMKLKQFIFKYGGYCVMFGFILYKFVTVVL